MLTDVSAKQYAAGREAILQKYAGKVSALTPVGRVTNITTADDLDRELADYEQQFDDWLASR